MKVCTVCNEIVSTAQGCSRVDCPIAGQPADQSEIRIEPGYTGQADRLVQDGLDRASDFARGATRPVVFAIAIALAISLVVGFFLFSDTHGGSLPPNATVTVKAEANVRSGPTSEGTVILGKLAAGTSLKGRWVSGATSATERWFEFEQGSAKAYVWEGNISGEPLEIKQVAKEAPKKPAPDASAFADQYPSTLIQGYSIFDAPDLQSTIKSMPNGDRIWTDVNKIRQSLSVEAPINIENPGPYQSLIISLCEQHNCGGPGSRQLLIEYFPSSKPKERQAFVCLKSGSSRSVYDPWGEGYMEGDECTAGGFFYGD